MEICLSVPDRIRSTREGWISGGLPGKRALLLVLATACAISGSNAAIAAETRHSENRSSYLAPHAAERPLIDGVANESVWDMADWYGIDHRWLGPEYTSDDFSGRFKVAWTKQRLYILVEVVDDILFDSHRDPLVQYWDDDCVEIFVDEDYSGGDHQYNHNAFAYHMSLDNQAIDIGTDERPRNYSHHVESNWKQTGNTIVWEFAIDIYTDEYVDGSDANQPVTLYAGKILGLMLAYCDNDGSEIRENFVGSESVPEGPKDRGWIDAGLFGELTLIDSE